MTDRDALLAQLATDLDALMTANSLTQKSVYLAAGLNPRTVNRVLRAYDCRVSTLATVGQALGYRVRIVFERP